MTRLSQADLMGSTLPYRFGGLNCPQLVYTMSNEIVSRADASLMNLYGLQGIAETINAYADEAIKGTVLPEMATGRKTGAMVLTEPDAGSDLQSIKVRAFKDGSGNWVVQGVKRFITNGCGDVLLVLARSEPEIGDARGLSLFLVERGPRVKVRRLEEKLGIHGSPTCELFFDDAPAQLIGQRQRGPRDLRHEPDERSPGGDRGTVAWHRRGRVPGGEGVRGEAPAVRGGDRRDPGGSGASR